MTGVSVAELAAAVNQLVEAANAREQDLFNWQEGTPTGGPYADGRYALRDYLGTVRYFKSPQRLQFEIDQLINDASTGFASATAAQTAAEAAADDSALSATAAAGSASAAATSATQADTFRQQAASSEANALTHRNNAASSATAAATSATNAQTHRTAAETAANNSAASATASAASASAAAASAAQAALFDVANYYTKTETTSLLSGKADTGHTHTLASLSGSLVNVSGSNLGIGTSSPTEKLDVRGGTGNGSVTVHVASPNAEINLKSDATNGYYPTINLYGAGASGGLVGKLMGYDGVYLDAVGNRSVVLRTNGSERLRVNGSGSVGIGTSAPTALFDINSDTVRLRTARTPASATATGNAGDICWDSSYVYVCTATNSWKRAALATW